MQQLCLSFCAKRQGTREENVPRRTRIHLQAQQTILVISTALSLNARCQTTKETEKAMDTGYAPTEYFHCN